MSPLLPILRLRTRAAKGTLGPRKRLLRQGSRVPTSLLLVLATALAVTVEPVAAQEAVNACDPGLQGDSRSPLAYRMRDSRCEGEFVMQVNNSPDLQLVSLVEHFEDFDASQDDLWVEWGALPETTDNLHLRVLTWRPRTYYRMDALVDPRPGRYRWSTDVLASLGHTRDDLGAVAWTAWPEAHQAAGEERFPVYLPLRLRQDDTSNRRARYQAGLYLARRAEEIYVTLEPIGPDGAAGPPLLDGEALPIGYYPASSVTELEIPDLAEEGLYRLLLSATFRDNSTATKAIYFYHSTAWNEEIH